MGNCALFPLDQTRYSLAKEYVPPLVAIPDTYLTDKKKKVFLEPTSGAQLILFLNALRKAGISVSVNSGYRNFDEQETLRNEQIKYLMAKGMSRSEAEKKTMRQVAAAGHSEHQLGTTVDLQFSLNYQVTIVSTAHKHGFIQTMVGNKDMDDEPWHFRYIGIENIEKYKDFISGRIQTEYPKNISGYLLWLWKNKQNIELQDGQK